MHFDCFWHCINKYGGKLSLVFHIKAYHIAGKFGGGEVWQIDSFQAFGERKFGELIDQPVDYLL